MKLKKIIIFIVVMAMAVPAPLWAAHTDGGCAGCHASHSSSSSAALEGITIPLWKGVLAPTTGFTAYTSTTLDATGVGQPDGDSRMCLSCHDGTTQTGVGISGSTDLTRDLSDDHPISFVYDTALATPATGDDNLNDPATTLIPGGAAGETIEAEWLDANGKVQCTTCHDVHAVHTDMALRTDNTTGGLCKTCHTL